MVRKVLAVACVLVFLAVLAPAGAQPPAQKQPAGQKQPARIRVLLPEEDAEVHIQDHLMKQTGTDRLFVSPPLEPGRTFYYTVKAVWEPNNYTHIIRTRKVAVQAGRQVEVDLRKPNPKSPDRLKIR